MSPDDAVMAAIGTLLLMKEATIDDIQSITLEENQEDLERRLDDLKTSPVAFIAQLDYSQRELFARRAREHFMRVATVG